ncbi:hypothetical protein O181_016822 [Austropuccinia psidii MF-1]|uniref:Uncharacterized protein n=1 Tax=Austropuccinia psidii MF-1 TaxID=1389203 RepID=A0A9Q3C6H5_9BASI|nr:hypothetical protein [Austropuccinia psidii MF-1]
MLLSTAKDVLYVGAPQIKRAGWASGIGAPPSVLTANSQTMLQEKYRSFHPPLPLAFHLETRRNLPVLSRVTLGANCAFQRNTSTYSQITSCWYLRPLSSLVTSHSVAQRQRVSRSASSILNF